MFFVSPQDSSATNRPQNDNFFRPREFAARAKSMLIREYTDADLGALRALHAAQGMPYAFPDLANPLFLTRLVAIDDAQDSRHPEAVRSRGISQREVCAGGLDINGELCSARARRDSAIIAAVFLRLTAEAYFLLDPGAGSPRDRWRALLLLHEAARGDANRRGLDDAHAWLPPQVARAFGRRIERLGWTREPWPCYSRTIAAPTDFSQI